MVMVLDGYRPGHQPSLPRSFGWRAIRLRQSFGGKVPRVATLEKRALAAAAERKRGSAGQRERIDVAGLLRVAEPE